MKTIKQSVQDTLNAVEKELRDKLFACAEANDYNGAVFAEGSVTMGQGIEKGLANRWLNALRLKSGLANGEVDYLFVCTELSRQDTDTLKRIHQAMPE